MNSEYWYSAQCVFLHAETVHGPNQMYEERIIVFRAESIEAAIARAEKEAEEYCRDLDNCRYIDYVNVFAMFDDEIKDGSEIFSSMHRSDLTPKGYLDLLYPASPEDCEAVSEMHRWYTWTTSVAPAIAAK